MKYEAYLSPLGTLQPSGSYLKIERIQKIERTRKNLKKGRTQK